MSNKGSTRDDLLEKYEKLMRSFIGKYSLGHNSLDVDDLLQESKIRLLKVLENGHEIKFLASYIKKIVDSIVLTHIHEIHKERSFLHSEGLRVFHEKRLLESQSDETKQEMKDFVRAAIDSLVGSRRIVLNMTMSGFSIQEIAETQKWTLKKTYNLYERGLKDLERIFHKKDRVGGHR
ncbi:MAG: hypothetical protein NTU60_09650 [Candidatus Aminicenantes bacterium]|nr:hypothetical protein [Candidatus Aminicenantes bacterium]